MPTVEQLARLEAITSRLQPLADAQRGEPVRAADWNTLVEAILGLARVLLAEARPEEVPAHEHLSEVQLSWLSDALRRRLEGGVGGSQVARDLDERRRADGLGRRLERLERRVERLTTDAARHAARNADALDDIAAARRSLTGLELAREDTLELRRSVEELRDGVQRVEQIRGTFEVDGEVLSGAALAERIDALEALQDRLRRPDGSLFDADSLDRSLAEIRAEFVSEADLREAIEGVPRGVADEVLDNLRGRIDTAVRDANVAARDTLEASLDARLDDRLASVDEAVAAGVEQLRPELEANLRGTLEAAASDRASAAAEAAMAGLDERLEALRGRLREGLDRQLEGLRGEIPALARGAAAESARGALADIERTVAGLRTRLEQQRERTDALDAAGDALRRDLTAGLRRITEARSTLSSRLEEVTRAQANLRNQVNQRITEATRGFGRDLSATRTALERQITNSVRAAATDAARAVEADLRRDMSGLVRAELTPGTETWRRLVTAGRTGPGRGG
jgi:chromosome segregation ATPase